jgi:hypothetical protein
MYKTQPFPHLFERNPLLESERLQLIKFCDKTKFRKVEGGAYIKFLHECEDCQIQNILKLLSNKAKTIFETHFKEFLSDKILEIASRDKLNQDFKYQISKYGPFINIVPKGNFINAHRDGYKNLMICIFYFGTTDNKESQTTSLLDGNTILNTYGEDPTGDEDFSNINRVNYGKTKNSAMYFFNSETAYHMVDLPIEADRIIVMMSLEITVC